MKNVKRLSIVMMVACLGQVAKSDQSQSGLLSQNVYPAKVAADGTVDFERSKIDHEVEVAQCDVSSCRKRVCYHELFWITLWGSPEIIKYAQEKLTEKALRCCTKDPNSEDCRETRIEVDFYARRLADLKK